MIIAGILFGCCLLLMCLQFVLMKDEYEEQLNEENRSNADEGSSEE